MSRTEYAVGEWWIAEKRGDGTSHLVTSLSDAPPLDEMSASLGYDYRLWASACGKIERGFYMYSTPERLQTAGYARCEECLTQGGTPNRRSLTAFKIM